MIRCRWCRQWFFPTHRNNIGYCGRKCTNAASNERQKTIYVVKKEEKKKQGNLLQEILSKPWR